MSGLRFGEVKPSGWIKERVATATPMQREMLVLPHGSFSADVGERFGSYAVTVRGNFLFLKGYTVFNVEQIEGLPEVYYAKAAPTLDPVARIDHAGRFFAASGATIRHGGNRAFYSLTPDAIQMPAFESFKDADSYYATLAHEVTHNANHCCHSRIWRLHCRVASKR